jgi:predicted nuclease with TOPRIM domain
MSELTERIEQLEKENDRLKEIHNSNYADKVTTLKAVIGTLKEELGLKNEDVCSLLPHLVKIEL